MTAGEIRHHRHRLPLVMGKRILIIGVLLIIAHGFSELSEVFERLGYGNQQVWPMINCDLPWYISGGINELWWIKYNTDSAMVTAVLLATVLISAMVSRRIMWIAIIWLSYHLFDWFMLWYDYRQSHWTYWILILDAAVSVAVLVKVKDRPKVKSLI